MTPRTIHIITVILTLVSSILAVGDKVTAIPLVPGWLANSWPFVLIVAGVFKSTAQAILAQPPTPKP